MIKASFDHKKALADLNRFFIDELIAGNYTVKSIDQYTVELILNDGGYRFQLWIANDNTSLCVYENAGLREQKNTIALEFTAEESITLHNRFNEHLRQKKTELKRERALRLMQEAEKIIESL